MKSSWNKYILVLFSILLLSISAYSQNRQEVDSILLVLHKEKEDTALLRIYISLFKICSYELLKEHAEQSLKVADRIPIETINQPDKNKLIEEKDSLYFFFENDFAIALEIAPLLLSYCQHLLSNYQDVCDTLGIIHFSEQICNRISTEDNLAQALDYCAYALSLAEKIKNKKIIADCLKEQAYIYKKSKDDEQALLGQQKSLSLYEEVKDTVNAGYALIEIGTSYGNLHNIPEALASFHQAISLFEITNDKAGLRMTYNVMGLVSWGAGDLENAMKHFKKALSIADTMEDKSYVRAILGNMGDIYRLTGDLPNALKYHYKALKEAKKINVIEGQIDWVWYQLAQDYYKLKNYKKAKEFNDLNLKSKKVSVFRIENFKNSEWLAYQIDSASGHFNTALEHYQQYIYWHDKLNVEEIRKSSLKDKLTADYAEQKAKEKAEQDKKDLLAQQKIKNQVIVRNSFVVVSILLIVLIIVFINRAKLKRTVEMERMRSRLSRDLHDDIGSTLSSINILSLTAQNDLNQAKNEKTKASLEKINDRSQRLLDNIGDIIWNINPGNDSLEEVMSRMREYATSILESKNINYTFNFPKEIIDCSLTMEIKYNVYLIFKEAVNNLVKYSNSTQALLSLTFDEKNIYIRVEDNGTGFNEDDIMHRGGLSNMRHRANEINGAIHITSVIGQGTTIELHLPRFC